MFTKSSSKWLTNGKELIEAASLSTDSKPTTGVANGSLCLEMDTGKIYAFNETGSAWVEITA